MWIPIAPPPLMLLAVKCTNSADLPARDCDELSRSLGTWPLAKALTSVPFPWSYTPCSAEWLPTLVADDAPVDAEMSEVVDFLRCSVDSKSDMQDHDV
jgi:hypothetical protein